VTVVPHCGPQALEFDGSKGSVWEHLYFFDYCENNCGHKPAQPNTNGSPCKRCGLVKKKQGYYRVKKVVATEKHDGYNCNPNTGFWKRFDGRIWEWVDVNEFSLYVTEGDESIITKTIPVSDMNQVLNLVTEAGKPGELCYHKKSDRWFLHL
jgi:hypothetical protein